MVLAGYYAFAQVDLSGPIALIREERFDEAETQLRSFLGQKQKNEDEVYYWIGYIRLQQESYQEAQKLFSQGMTARSKSPLNSVGLGWIALIENRLSDAIISIESGLVTAKGKDPEVEFAAAEAYLRGGVDERGKAKQILYQLRDANPDDPRTYIMLGEYYKRQGVPELAIEELEKAIQKAPKYVPAYVYLAELYFDEGKATNSGDMFQKGLNMANKAIQLNADYAPAYRIRGELYLLAKQYDRARDDLKTYVSKTEGDLKAEIRYASFLFLAEDYPACIAQLDKIDTTTNVMLRLKGMSLSKMGRDSEALATMDQYFNSVKKEEYIIWQDYQVYGDILRSMGRLDDADAYYEKMILKNPDQGDIFDRIAEDYGKQNTSMEKEGAQLARERRQALIAASEATDAYNSLRDTDPEKAKEQYAIREAKVAEAEAKQARIDELNAKLKANYPIEAHYRQEALDHSDNVTLGHYYSLGVAQFKSEQWKPADGNFKKVNELKADYVPAYSYRLRIANALEQEDTTSMNWFVLAPAEDIIKVWGDVAPASLDDRAKEALLVACDVKANYAFNPTTKEGDYHCDDARPWIEKIFILDPNYKNIAPLSDYCEIRPIGNR
ncbi:MAG: hypothetical protein OHK0039_02220 [Bacteroidia bacterium]